MGLKTSAVTLCGTDPLPPEVVAKAVQAMLTQYTKGDLAALRTTLDEERGEMSGIPDFSALDALSAYHLAPEAKRPGCFASLKKVMEATPPDKGLPRLVIEMWAIAAEKPGFKLGRKDFTLLEDAATTLSKTDAAPAKKSMSGVINRYIEAKVPKWPSASDEKEKDGVGPSARRLQEMRRSDVFGLRMPCGVAAGTSQGRAERRQRVGGTCALGSQKRPSEPAPG